MNILKNKLKEANTVCYVTDATKAFISMSEVKNFKRIKILSINIMQPVNSSI